MTSAANITNRPDPTDVCQVAQNASYEFNDINRERINGIATASRSACRAALRGDADSDTLAQKIELFREAGRVFRKNEELFAEIAGSR